MNDEPRKLALIGTCKACKKEFTEYITTQTGMHTITCECGETIQANLDKLTAVDMAADHPRLINNIVQTYSKNDSRQRIGIMAGLAAAGIMNPGISGTMFGRSGYREPKKSRPCVNCKTPHTHNNSFCSAECCKEYRAKKS